MLLLKLIPIFKKLKPIKAIYLSLYYKNINILFILYLFLINMGKLNFKHNIISYCRKSVLQCKKKRPLLRITQQKQRSFFYHTNRLFICISHLYYFNWILWAHSSTVFLVHITECLPFKILKFHFSDLSKIISSSIR